MTDPIRPLVTLVESITRNSHLANSKATEQDAARNQSAADPARSGLSALAAKPFATLLRTRLAGVDRTDKKQLRRVFIEVSLLNEFGEELIIDPGFAALVEQVSEIISADQAATIKLDKTLESYLA